MPSRSSREDSHGGALRTMTRPVGRRAGIAALSCLGVFFAWVLLWPSAGPASAVVDAVLGVLHDIGLPTRLVTGARVEFALNASMVAPVPLLAAWAGARWSWERWTAYAFVTAVALETIQGLVAPSRSAQFQDVSAYTLGICLGAMVGRLIVRGRGRTRRDGRARLFYVR